MREPGTPSDWLRCPQCNRLPDDAMRPEVRESRAKRDYLGAEQRLRCGACQVPYVRAEEADHLSWKCRAENADLEKMLAEEQQRSMDLEAERLRAEKAEERERFHLRDIVSRKPGGEKGPWSVVADQPVHEATPEIEEVVDLLARLALEAGANGDEMAALVRRKCLALDAQEGER